MNKKSKDKMWMEDTIFKKNYEEKIKRAIDQASKIKPSDNNSWSGVFETIEQIINNSTH